MNVEPVVLEGKYVRLEPMRVDHLPALCKAGVVDALWQWTTAIVKDEADMERYLRTALADQAKGIALPFVTIDRKTDTLVGSTRFGNIDTQNRKAEIGWTWINPEFQRTVINTEAKLLMLTHAFDVWKCVRVELKTDSNNKVSRKAIKRIGGIEEGTLRNHMIRENGQYRHSVYFSIIDSEWESVRADLTSKIVEIR
ncbi:MAG TPA: GNAT family protein [Pyrinomonadaceae bacterium]|jgi:RimJ/RimL family protein N-acetyltransferase|nr:GNAT family protein [Pyrinomonadaceae bacterium]